MGSGILLFRVLKTFSVCDSLSTPVRAGECVFRTNSNTVNIAPLAEVHAPPPRARNRRYRAFRPVRTDARRWHHMRPRGARAAVCRVDPATRAARERRARAAAARTAPGALLLSSARLACRRERTCDARHPTAMPGPAAAPAPHTMRSPRPTPDTEPFLPHTAPTLRAFVCSHTRTHVLA